MTRPSKTFDFKFFLKIPGCMIEKKVYLDRRLKSLDSRH